MAESELDREARLARTAMASFLAIEESQRLLAGSARRLADLESERVEKRLLAESEAWFAARGPGS